MFRILTIVGCAVWAGPSVALDLRNCSQPDAKVVERAVEGATALVLQASEHVGDTPEFTAWFGPWSEARGDEVRTSLRAIHLMLDQRAVDVVCPSAQDVDCESDTFAYVLYEQPGVIHLCPSFFRMPSLEEARGAKRDIENGTREGTILHELSHFPFLANTGDDCYGRETCRGLATGNPASAIRTADNFQYFAEDVVLAIWATGP